MSDQAALILTLQLTILMSAWVVALLRTINDRMPLLFFVFGTIAAIALLEIILNSTH